MSKSKMSPDALARCRSMVIEGLEDGLRHEIRVYDPKFPGKAVASHIVRTDYDRQRFCRSWMQLYKIPRENITQLSFKAETTEEKDNANVTVDNSTALGSRGSAPGSSEADALASAAPRRDEGQADSVAKEMPVAIPQKLR